MDYVSKEKLKWRSRRSMLELDLFFDRFILTGKFEQLSEKEFVAYQQLLELDDGDLLALFQGKDKLEDNDMQSLVCKIAQVNI
jgi:succinate dehydrogenase flavin-adding protein (antitoxin of CptAB toxin-antitoxin module)